MTKYKLEMKSSEYDKENLSEEPSKVSGYIFWPVFLFIVLFCLIVASFISYSFDCTKDKSYYFGIGAIICAWSCKEEVRWLMSSFSIKSLILFIAKLIGGVFGISILCLSYELLSNWGCDGTIGWLLSVAVTIIIVVAFVVILSFLHNLKKQNGEKKMKKHFLD